MTSIQYFIHLAVSVCEYLRLVSSFLNFYKADSRQSKVEAEVWTWDNNSDGSKNSSISNTNTSSTSSSSNSSMSTTSPPTSSSPTPEDQKSDCAPAPAPAPTQPESKILNYCHKNVNQILKGSSSAFRCVRELGSGYAGTVYQCVRTRSTGDVVWQALKVMYKRKVRVEAAEREARLLRRAKGCPNVLSLHVGIECRDAWLLSTELCSRGDLHGLLHAMDDKDVLTRKLLIGTAKGLRHIHDCNIAHCDIKMRNILVTGNNVPKIADFGFAQQLSHRWQRTSQCQGTRDYWAPEMWPSHARFSPVMADVYALAVTFLGVCERRPIKRKDNDLWNIVNSIEIQAQRQLFRSLLRSHPDDRAYLTAVENNAWVAAVAPVAASPGRKEPREPRGAGERRTELLEYPDNRQQREQRDGPAAADVSLRLTSLRLS